MEKLIVCLTGMPGAGKSTIAAGLKVKGYEIITMGDAVRDEVKKRGLEQTSANMGQVMIDLRKKNGPGAVAELVKAYIKNIKSNVVIVDGIRSNNEISILRQYGNVKLLAVHASTSTRFEFLQNRGRADDPQTKENFQTRDERELGVGISDSIALSEEVINNNNKTKDELINAALEKINFWLK